MAAGAGSRRGSRPATDMLHSSIYWGGAAGGVVAPGVIWVPITSPDTIISTRRFSFRPAAVLLSATGLPLPKAARNYVVDRDPVVHQVVPHRPCPLLRQGLVVGIAADAVGVALNLQTKIGIGEDDA